MKKKLLFSVLLLISISSFGYKSTIQKGNIFSFYVPMGLGNNLYYNHIVGCDTVVDAKVYNKIYSSNASGSDLIYFGLIREDTLAGKIYYINTSNQPERLIIDYAVNIGDTFDFYFGNYSATVDSIKYENLFGELRKTIYFDSQLKFIEGIGCSFWGVLPTQNTSSNAYGVLLGKNFEDIDCSAVGITTTTTVEKNVERCRLSPCPAATNIEVKFDDNNIANYKYEIYDSRGRLVETKTNVSSKIIPIEILNNGLYLIRFYYGNVVLTNKFTKIE